MGATKVDQRNDLAARVRLIPLGDRVVVRRTSPGEQTVGGIFLPDSAKDRPTRGVILAVGDGRILDSGLRVRLTVKVGDEVLFTSYAPALLDILEKSVRELGAIRLIDSRIGVPGQLACNPRVILGRFTTTIGFAWLHILVLLVILRLHCIH